MRSPPRRQNLQWADHALNGLIVGGIERIAGGAGQHGLEPLAHGNGGEPLGEADRLFVARHDLAVVKEGHMALVVDDAVDGASTADHRHDLQLLLVQRIALQHAVGAVGMFHEARAVEGGDGLGVCDAGRDHLAPARPAGHEVRLHQAGGDAQIGLDEAPVEPHHRATPGRSDQHVIGVLPGEMVRYVHRLQHPGIADQSGKLFALVGPVQPGRDQHRDLLRRQPGAEQGADQGWQDHAVGHRAREVADEDADAPGTRGLLRKQRASHGPGESLFHGLRRIGEQRHRLLRDHGDVELVGQIDRSVAPAIVQINAHSLSLCHGGMQWQLSSLTAFLRVVCLLRVQLQ